jgi:anti-sigma regulatory factor (Ser/Thr protein kinase)
MIFKDIQSTFPEVDVAVEQVKELLQGLGCPKLSSKKTFVIFALRELLNNAVKHGNLCDSRKKVIYRIHCDGHKIQLDVWDEGPGFTLPDRVWDDSANKILHMASRGIFIMQKMDFQLAVAQGHITAILDL